ncbi:glycosyltransferase [Azospirillum sp. sgz301742]
MPAAPVVATIVTFNRLALLRACVEGVRAQEPRPERIVVVDNGSTDGTAEWLAEQPDLDVVRQKNCGSAGAYHTAFARAMELGLPWIWAMDDDGRAEPGALAELLRQADAHRLDIVGALVVAAQGPDELAFRIGSITRVEDAEAAEQDGVLHNEVCPFNGTLMHRRVFEAIGNIKREMFIWGDEWEFGLRARRAGLRIATAVHARHVHPRSRSQRVSLFGGRLGWVEEMPEARAPHYFRNMGYIHARYERPAAIPRTLVKYALYHVLMRRDVAGFARFAGCYLSGLIDRYPAELRAPPTPLP